MKLATKLSLNAALALGTALVLIGCQTVPYAGQAHDVKRRPGAGGIVAVPNNPRQEDRDRATEHMISNCGSGSYKITEEGEVVIGEATEATTRNDYRQNTQQTTGSFLGMPIVSGDPGGSNTQLNSIRTQMKEWQLTYECNSGASAPAATPVASPAKKKKH